MPTPVFIFIDTCLLIIGARPHFIIGAIIGARPHFFKGTTPQYTDKADSTGF